MSKNLLIVFVKNIKHGETKTRLAKTIGTEGALLVYRCLVEITERAIQGVNAEKHIYFSDKIIDKNWKKTSKFVQNGADLGEKMKKAFKNGQKNKFEKIVLIGSDLPDISPTIIQRGFDALENSEVVFGPAEDGGYYLVGMTKPRFCIFENKQWSTENLLEETINELEEKGIRYSLLETLNDVDTIDDLKKSRIFESVKKHFIF